MEKPWTFREKDREGVRETDSRSEDPVTGAAGPGLRLTNHKKPHLDNPKIAGLGTMTLPKYLIVTCNCFALTFFFGRSVTDDNPSGRGR